MVNSHFIIEGMHPNLCFKYMQIRVLLGHNMAEIRTLPTLGYTLQKLGFYDGKASTTA